MTLIVIDACVILPKPSNILTVIVSPDSRILSLEIVKIRSCSTSNTSKIPSLASSISPTTTYFNVVPYSPFVVVNRTVTDVPSSLLVASGMSESAYDATSGPSSKALTLVSIRPIISMRPVNLVSDDINHLPIVL